MRDNVLMFPKPLDYVIKLNDRLHLDANSHKYPQNIPKNSWIGSYCNEPKLNESVNAILVVLVDCDKKHIPAYPAIDKSNQAFIEITNVIKKGEQILVDYGLSNTVHKRLGYNFKTDKRKYVTAKTDLEFENLSEKKCIKMKSCLEICSLRKQHDKRYKSKKF